MPKLLILLFLIPFHLSAQVFPKEGSKLNYRLIGFSFPVKSGEGNYSLEIARGNHVSTTTFEQNIIRILDVSGGKVIADVPAFGSDYTWRTVSGDSAAARGELHHFSTTASPYADPSLYRMRVTKNTGAYKDAYMFVDCTRALYDMSGNPVWFLPDSGHSNDDNSNIRDLKLSPQGTLTFINANEIYDVNYNGSVLWKGPNDGKVSHDTNEHYHHEFTRLSNGHYMVLGDETTSWLLPFYKPDTVHPFANEKILKSADGLYYQHLSFGDVIEYDEKGNVVWTWRSSDYFKKSDLFGSNLPDGKFLVWDVHENSFFFDEAARVVYVGFRDISRIVKVKYPEGTVLAVYGKKYSPGTVGLGNDMFEGQHSLGLLQNGNLYLFNNRPVTPGSLPKVEILVQPKSPKDTLREVWEYTCTAEGMDDSELTRINKQNAHVQRVQQEIRHEQNPGHPLLHNHFTPGGKVMELQDESLFVSMCSPYSKVFIIDKNKEILWSAIIEKKLQNDSTWRSLFTYRASIVINRDDLERMIWNSEK